MDDIDDFGPMIPSPSGKVNAMEADFHSRGSISAVHELEVAAYGSHGRPPPLAERPSPPNSFTQAFNMTVQLGTAISLPVDNTPSSSDASNDITHSLPHNKMYVISYHEANHTNGRHMGGCPARLTQMNPSTQIHPVILSWLADNWEIEIGSDRDSIKCYTEMKVKEGPVWRSQLSSADSFPTGCAQ
jgi:hypothetical protein